MEEAETAPSSGRANVTAYSLTIAPSATAAIAAPAKAIVAEQSVRVDRIDPAAKRSRNALRRFVCELLRHLDQLMIETLAAEVRSRQLLLCPFHGCADREIIDGANIVKMVERVGSGLALIRTVNVPGFMRCVQRNGFFGATGSGHTPSARKCNDIDRRTHGNGPFYGSRVKRHRPAGIDFLERVVERPEAIDQPVERSRIAIE